MKDFFNSLTEALRDRITNPFLGSFALTWIILNWKFTLLFFSGDYLTNIKINMLVTDHTDLHRMTWIPFLTALTYILAMPYFYWGIEKLQNHAKIRRHEEKKEYLKQISEALSESADAAEKAVKDQKRMDVTEHVSEENTDEYARKISIKNDHEKGPIFINTERNGATLTFPYQLESLQFKVCMGNQHHQEAEYEIRADNFAGASLGQFTLPSYRGIQNVNLNLQGYDTDRIVIVKIGEDNFTSKIELYNLIIEERLPF